MNYMIASNLIKIGVESKYSCGDTSSLKFVTTLAAVLEDVRKMCEAAQIAAKI